jgi:UDP-N-acetylmuramate-alanine ligase
MVIGLLDSDVPTSVSFAKVLPKYFKRFDPFRLYVRLPTLCTDFEEKALVDDFAHHPSAIQTTLEVLRKKIGNDKIVAILELRSNTMKSGVHQQSLVKALKEADQVFILKPDIQIWDIGTLFDDVFLVLLGVAV